jgi:GNAT superfamily N-acetyltransferase
LRWNVSEQYGTIADMSIKEEGTDILSEYMGIPIAFTVESILDVTRLDGDCDFRLEEKAVDEPYVKDYDAFNGGSPTRWAELWDISNWGVLAAYCNGERIGGAVIAYDTVGVDKLEGRDDLAVLWDIRVRPDYRGTGVGTRLFAEAVEWAKARGCCRFKIETQNINVPACSFYKKQECKLVVINRDAYDEFPDEVELIWEKMI